MKVREAHPSGLSHTSMSFGLEKSSISPTLSSDTFALNPFVLARFISFPIMNQCQ
jgi:hypothetical protein